MSLFRWFSRTPRHGDGQAPASQRSVRLDDSSGARQLLRGERSARREQLYVIVREAMVRVGILSAGYKFKVLSLDTTGQRFVVMVDLAPAYAADAAQQKNIESLIAELAYSRIGVGVHAVYWRINGQISSATESAAGTVQSVAKQARPSAVEAYGGRPFDPIDAMEMNAFKHAVAMSGSAAPQPEARHSRFSPLLGPGSGQEEGGEFSVSGLGSLGVTQYGDLR